jgi:succinate dehydrogenase / fumarate reductase cytochrome b subunit
MSSTRVPHSNPAPRPAAPPLVRRLLSLTGVLPLGAFVLAHLAVNARALRSETAFALVVGAIHGMPATAFLEWLFVLAPLAVHAAIGLWLVVTRRPLAEHSPYPRSLAIAVRATGVVAMGFLAMHLPELRFREAGGRLGGNEMATVLSEDLSSIWHGVPWRGAAYLTGTACVSFHFAAGLWGFAVTTRAGRGPRVRRWAAWGAIAFGATIWGMFANVVVFHATGSRLFGGAKGEPDGSSAACPSTE